jgi:RNA polymerase sigma-70 factor (ECF subfamily)
LKEKVLIEKILAGDEAAKTLFYNSHLPRLKPICVHFLGYQDPDIDDIIQQTFLIAFEKLPEFQPRSTLYTWIAHICVNLCYERLRKRKRVLATLQEELEMLTVSIVHAREAERENQSEQSSKIALIERLLGSMSEKCRKIIEMRDRQGESYAVIGKLLKLPMGTVMSQLARCRETLKTLVLHDREGGLP